MANEGQTRRSAQHACGPATKAAIDLFCCAGGAALGVHAAGFHHEVLVDVDEDAVTVARAAGFAAVRCDVRAFDRWVAQVSRPVWLAWASPDCTVWSRAGKRTGALGRPLPLFGRAASDRNGWPMTWATVDRLREARLGPRWLMCENVPGMVDHLSSAHQDGAPVDPMRCPGCYFERVVLVELRRRFASVDWRILNCADFGVPQTRSRLFVVCGPVPYSWPTPTHAGRWVSVFEALGPSGLGTMSPGDTATRSSTNPRDESHERKRRDCTHEPAPTVNAGAGNQGVWLTTGAHDQTDEQGLRDLFLRHQSDSARTRARPLDCPSPTISTRGTLALERRDGTMTRRLTQLEEAALQCFPATYPWHLASSDRARRRLSGRAVPPIMAEALARQVLASEGCADVGVRS